MVDAGVPACGRGMPNFLPIFHSDFHPRAFIMLGSRSTMIVYSVIFKGPMLKGRFAPVNFRAAATIGRCLTVAWCFLMSMGIGLHSVAAQDAILKPQGNLSVKQFAPGVLTTIAADVQEEEIDSIHDLVEIRANKKLERESNTSSKSRVLFEMAHNAHFRSSVRCLEFTFKPLRMLEVDVPQKSGKMQRKLIWYLVYRVRNTGIGLASQEQADGTFAAIPSDQKQMRFIPQLVLVSLDRDQSGQRVRKAYLDRIIPTAIGPIERREVAGGRLLNSVQVAEQLLTPEVGRGAQGIWGVATWEDVDPAIDFFSVFVGGLSNALKWHDPPGAYQTGDLPGKGRKFLRKTLQLNFWRPGDDLAENEREIRYGIPPGRAKIYDCDEGVAHRWVYR